MIVGLKKRQRSKEFYELAKLHVVDKKTHHKTSYRDGKPEVVRDWAKEYAIVEAFSEIRENYGRKSEWKWVALNLIEKICDETVPENCQNRECKYRFKCATTRLGL